MNQTLLIVGGLLLAVAGNATLTKNKLTERHELELRQQEMRTELERTRSQISQLPQLRQEGVSARGEMVDLKNRFPAQENLGVLLDDLEQAASESGLKVTAINRQVTPSPIPGFNQVNLDLLADGDYPSAVAFLNRARDAARLLNVTQFRSDGKQQSMSVTGYIRQGLPGE